MYGDGFLELGVLVMLLVWWFLVFLVVMILLVDFVSFCIKVMKFLLFELSIVVGIFLEGFLCFFFLVVFLVGLELLKKLVLLLFFVMMLNGLCVCGCECVWLVIEWVINVDCGMVFRSKDYKYIDVGLRNI